jgi:hypothetical protein
MTTILLTIVCFGLFCGGLAIAGMIGDWLDRKMNGGE